MPPDGYVSLAAGASRIGMSRATLGRRVAAGLCPARWTRGRCWVLASALLTVPRASAIGWRQIPRRRRLRLARARA